MAGEWVGDLVAPTADLRAARWVGWWAAQRVALSVECSVVQSAGTKECQWAATKVEMTAAHLAETTAVHLAVW